MHRIIGLYRTLTLTLVLSFVSPIVWCIIMCNPITEMQPKTREITIRRCTNKTAKSEFWGGANRSWFTFLVRSTPDCTTVCGRVGNGTVGANQIASASHHVPLWDTVVLSVYRDVGCSGTELLVRRRPENKKLSCCCDSRLYCVRNVVASMSIYYLQFQTKVCF